MSINTHTEQFKVLCEFADWQDGGRWKIHFDELPNRLVVCYTAASQETVVTFALINRVRYFPHPTSQDAQHRLQAAPVGAISEVFGLLDDQDQYRRRLERFPPGRGHTFVLSYAQGMIVVESEIIEIAR